MLASTRIQRCRGHAPGPNFGTLASLQESKAAVEGELEGVAHAHDMLGKVVLLRRVERAAVDGSPGDVQQDVIMYRFVTCIQGFWDGGFSTACVSCHCRIGESKRKCPGGYASK